MFKLLHANLYWTLLIIVAFFGCNELDLPSQTKNSETKGVTLTVNSNKGGLILNVDGNFRVADIVNTFGPQNQN